MKGGEGGRWRCLSASDDPESGRSSFAGETLPSAAEGGDDVVACVFAGSAEVFGDCGMMEYVSTVRLRLR